MEWYPVAWNTATGETMALQQLTRTGRRPIITGVTVTGVLVTGDADYGDGRGFVTIMKFRSHTFCKYSTECIL